MIAALKAPGVALQADGLIALRQVALSARTDPVLAALPGGFATRRKGHGQEVADVREYVAGDEIRHLDRGTTARTGTLHVRQFQEERDRVCLLVADFRPSMLWGVSRAFRSVAAAEALSMIGWRVAEEGGRVGVLVIGQGRPEIVFPRGRTRGMLDAIGALVRGHQAALDSAAQGQMTEISLEKGLLPVERIAPLGAEIVIASGFDIPGEGLHNTLDRLSRRRMPRLVQIVDAQPQTLPKGSYPIRLPNGRRTRVAIRADENLPPPIVVNVGGHQALLLDAGKQPTETARRIASAFPLGYRQ